MRKVSLEDMIGCARRELALRRKAFPKWVAKGTMTPEKAAWEIEMMEGIVEQLERDAGRKECENPEDRA